MKKEFVESEGQEGFQEEVSLFSLSLLGKASTKVPVQEGSDPISGSAWFPPPGFLGISPELYTGPADQISVP